MSIFIGSNAGETITPDAISSSVKVVGGAKKPSNAADIIFAGGGNDTVAGGGNDLAFLGAGDDTFIWNGGDGDDVVGGDKGFDTLEFNGANLNEEIEISSLLGAATVKGSVDIQGQRLSSTLVLESMERIDIAALGGADRINVKSLGNTDVKHVAIDLAGTPGGTSGDGAEDRVTIDGTRHADSITVTSASGAIAVTGLTAKVTITGAEAANDTLVIAAGTGNDSIDASDLAADLIQLEILAGDGNDAMKGSAGSDRIVGGRGDDVAHMGDGDDTFVWNPGEGSDVVEGGDGFFDAMDFVGNGANENVDIAANGERARFFRQPGNITMDVNDVEKLTFNALGGTDDITVHDLTGTDVQEVTLDLASELFGDTSDGQIDEVNVEGTADADFIDVLGFGGSLAIIGTPAFVSIDHFDATDVLTLRGLGGDDQISASSVASGSIQMVFDGGAGDDTFFGSQGIDTFVGGDGDDFVTGNRGDDVALLGAGDDFFIWNPGDGSDVIEGGAGTDFMGFRGANVAENIDIFANGERVNLVRDVANVTMDLNNVERMTLNAFGGVDNIHVGDLTGTDMQDIEISLLNLGLPNDGARDSITIDGSADDDTIDISTANLSTSIDGLAAHVSISGADAGLDQLTIDGGIGDDTINASALDANLFRFSMLGGDGDDVLFGSAGNDVILGDAGDDVLFGGAGDDVLFGGDGDDVLDGGAGDDVLIGGLGDDVFLNGEVTIDGFAAGAGSEDRIDMRSLGVSFDWIMAHASDVDGSTLLDFGDSEMLLTGVATTSLHQDDFLLA